MTPWKSARHRILPSLVIHGLQFSYARNPLRRPKGLGMTIAVGEKGGDKGDTLHRYTSKTQFLTLETTQVYK